MSVDTATIRTARDADRRAVRVGTAVTAVATLLLFVLPDLLPVDAVSRWYFERTGTVVGGNPFTPLRLCGGLLGGAACGRLTSDLGSGAVTGAKAALYGLVVAYLAVVGFYTVYGVAVVGAFPPPVLTILSVPLIYALPLFGTHLIGGAAAGFAADRLG